MFRLGKQVMIFDGGLGTEIAAAGLADHIPEDLNISHAEAIRKIHRSYSAADCISTNTFGLNRIKYKGAYDIRTVADAAIANARSAGKYVFFDVGPTGALLRPVGTLSFDEAYAAYAEIADYTKDSVDGYIVETFSDLYELKACVLALREHADKPIFATVTFDGNGRTLTGATPRIVAMVLEGLGVDALGVNCSLGPDEMTETVRELLQYSHVPVIVQPNRGLPKLKDGRTYYDLSVDTFVACTEKFLDMGVSVIGGCCGTTPECIERLAANRNRPVVRPVPAEETAVCSGTKTVVIDSVKICGERLNPTGKKALKEALTNGDYDYLVGEAVKQAEAGADLLDLNVGVPRVDEPAVMENAVRKVQEYVDLPLQIDSSDPSAIERGVRYYNGVPLINSVNGEPEVMDRIFPIAKKYGAVVLGLTMAGNGVPRTAAERCAIAERIIARAGQYGIPRRKIMIDTLVLTASAEQALVKETAEALRLVRALGVKTALGVSNVSFGLPNRSLLNKTFLTMAMTCGLNMPIMNPLDGEMTAAVRAFAVLTGTDAGAARYIESYRDAVPVQSTPTVKPAGGRSEESDTTLYDCVCRGRKNKVRALTEQELLTRPPLEVVEQVLVRALGAVGDGYEQGKLFLPQLIAAAEAAKEAFAVIGERLPKGGADKGKVVLATVKGDVHDIGKNIVKVVLESYGYSVIDLGKDTPIERVVEAVQTHNPLAVGLSALMTTTVASMEQTVKALRAAGCRSVIFVGGAVLTADIARDIDADCYTANALEFVKVLESKFLLKK